MYVQNLHQLASPFCQAASLDIFIQLLVQVSRSDIFKEVTLELPVTDSKTGDTAATLLATDYKVHEYKPDS